MIYIKRRILFFCFILIFAVLFCGCSQKAGEEVTEPQEPPVEAPVPTPTPKPEIVAKPVSDPEPAPEETPEEEPDLPRLALNNLTGLPISEELVARRPVAVVINNIHKALPQSGISQADLYYEVLAEGDITRIVAVFKDFDSKKIGPVRSTREYFGYFVMDNDAIFVHHGGSDGGYIFIKTNKLDAIDGMRAGATFWRDQERLAIRGMYEHSSYTNAERIFKEIEKREFRTELDEKNAWRLFDFYEELSYPEGGIPLTQVTIPFVKTQSPVFVYDETHGTFSRFQAGGPHIDEETGAQIEVSNIIVQFASMKVIDSAGRRQVNLVAEGEGYIITGGHYAPITWEKKSLESPTEYFDENGDKLTVNKGKTWICVLQNTADAVFE